MRSIEDRMAGYAAYHRNPKNKLTHFFGVPMVYYTPLIPLGWSWARFEVAGLELSLAMVVFLLVMLWYFTLDWQLASWMVVLSLPIVIGMDWISRMEFTQSLWIFLGIKGGGWVIQLVGHYFEGRRPALVDNLLQSLMAPLFLIAEVLFHFGFRKELLDAVEAKVPHFAAR